MYRFVYYYKFLIFQFSDCPFSVAEIKHFLNPFIISIFSKGQIKWIEEQRFCLREDTGIIEVLTVLKDKRFEFRG